MSRLRISRAWIRRHPRVGLALLYAILPLLFAQVVLDCLYEMKEEAHSSWADNWGLFQDARDSILSYIRRGKDETR